MQPSIDNNQHHHQQNKTTPTQTVPSSMAGDDGGRPSKTADLDAPLHVFGFEIDVVSPSLVNGRLRVTPKCCQPFKVLHGGVSALIAEALGSIGAHVASGFKRIAGVQLSINHIKAALLGDLVFAEALPVSVGKTIQVWEVKMWKIDPSTMEKRALLATSRVTLLSNLPVPDNAKEAESILRRHAKL
ncbi:hypothetical protein QJS10_CPA02g00134 [Acorus calamus]|uniref:Thioesterase domain-containing protein n=1 Tax=Acorus calamus TaxID=4465 RepID=A0AAV9FA99_ACOCL|nr:hypothetical protein QJS10_CPA02g00134 [Acorus calamus]